MAYKGFFRPQNPSKYKGDPSNVVYRSSWELKMMNWLDRHPSVILWASEEFCIPYISPIDGRVHRYFPDFFVKTRNTEGAIQNLVIEVKPLKQTVPPQVQSRKTPRYISEVRTWGVNSSKWKAARDFCAQRNWQFILMTEKEIYGNAIPKIA